MNKSIVKEYPRFLHKIPVGSHAYGFPMENSDKDFLHVYCIPRSEAFEDPIHYFREQTKAEDIIYLELSNVERLIRNGYPEMGDLLFSQEARFRTKHFDYLRSQKYGLISKESLKTWLQLSNKYFKNSKQLAKRENKTALDFMYLIGKTGSEPKSVSLTDCIKNKSFDTTGKWGSCSMTITTTTICVVPVQGVKNAYLLFHHFLPLDVPIIDDEGDIQVSGYNGPVFVGTVIYDKKAHDEHKRIPKVTITRGYYAKALVHAFRLLERIETFCDKGEVIIKVEKPAFYYDILKGNNGGQYYDDIYKQYVEKVSDLIRKSTFIENINNIQLTRAIEEVRSQVENVLVKL